MQKGCWSIAAGPVEVDAYASRHRARTVQNEDRRAQYLLVREIKRTPVSLDAIGMLHGFGRSMIAIGSIKTAELLGTVCGHNLTADFDIEPCQVFSNAVASIETTNEYLDAPG